MKYMLQKLLLSLLILAGPLFCFPTFAQAADIRQGDSVTIDAQEHNLKNVYVFGEKITVNAPITEDLVIAGGHILTNSSVSGNIITAGGDLLIKSTVAKSVRAAGGTIVIDGNVGQDVVVAGGDVTIAKSANIGGDLIIAGGTVHIDGPVHGKVMFNGGDVTINNLVGKGAQGNAGKITLGSNAAIHGDFNYTSDDKANIGSGATITGQTNFQQVKTRAGTQAAESFFRAASVYKLTIDILLSIMFIYFFNRFILQTVTKIPAAPWKNAGIGFLFLFLFPLAAMIGLLLLWLGFAAFLFYVFTIIVAVFIAKIFVGWYALRWWEKRSNHTYVLDWKAGLVGPMILFLLLFIPILGWLVAFIILLMALGAMLIEFKNYLDSQKTTTKIAKKA